MEANIEAFTNSIRKIVFWNVKSRIVAVLQSNHFRVVSLSLFLLIGLTTEMTMTMMTTTMMVVVMTMMMVLSVWCENVA
jgi:hypothetical protein